tara:strand:+ start:11083 stop:11688 length:606 start_codon:yes stop_codon:yes gene_type:complete
MKKIIISYILIFFIFSCQKSEEKKPFFELYEDTLWVLDEEKESIFGPNIRRIIRFKSNKFFWGAIENFNTSPFCEIFYFMHKEGSTTYEEDENYRDPTGFVEIVEFSSPSSDTLILNISYNPHPDEDQSSAHNGENPFGRALPNSAVITIVINGDKLKYDELAYLKDQPYYEKHLDYSRSEDFTIRDFLDYSCTIFNDSTK